MGSLVWIEVGAKWADEDGRKVKVAGRWRECVIVDGAVNTSADVVVRFTETASQ